MPELAKARSDLQSLPRQACKCLWSGAGPEGGLYDELCPC